MLLVDTKDLINLENTIEELDITNKEILSIIKDRQDNNCMVKILSKYYTNNNEEEIDELMIKDHDFYVKVISIELTKCLFESDFNMPRLDYQCYVNQWGYENVGKCISSFTKNNIIWTTFNGYLNLIDQIHNRNIEKIENLIILNDYKDIIYKLNNYIVKLIKDNENQNNKMNFEMDIIHKEFRDLIKEMIQEYESKRGDQENLLMEQYYNNNKNYNSTTDIKNQTNNNNNIMKKLVLKIGIRNTISAAMTFSILSCFLVYLVISKYIYREHDTSKKKKREYSLEHAILERSLAFVVGIIILQKLRHIFSG
jgi:hypothetical protein